ncbi:MAG: SPOR domain-containing protein [Bacteroidetes bacterium]|nr:SPOR domain-containing protein [Bacteroidota bacterium]
MNKYIIELLKAHTRVIIPDFGAFIVKVTEAPDGEDGTRKISFNDFLKFNDGVLINHIIKTENINKVEAVKKIKEYIKSVEQEFRKNNKYVIDDLGELSKDNRGGISFSAKGEVKEKVEVKKVEAKKPEKKKIEETKKEPVAKKESIMKPIPKIEKKQAANFNKKEKPSEEKKNVILPVAIIVVLVAAISWSIYYFDVIQTINNKYFAKTETKAAEKTIESIIETKEISDTTASAVELDAVMPVEKNQAEKVQKSNVRKYYLVAGSFNIEANAKGFIDKLTEKGFTPEYIGERNGFYTVCYSSFGTEREAYNELERMKKQEIQSWVLHY